MSCINCLNKNKEGSATIFPCLCDQFIHPQPLNIGAGLSSLPRQVATFPEFRRAMLHAVRSEEIEIIDKNNLKVKLRPLSNWRARDKDDLGIMLLEMWAYVCDSLSFYDEVIANETYLRTSRLRPDTRRLVALLGYLPRPAVGSIVELAALADGRLQLKLPVGTAFRSGAFDGNPPQVFELDKDAFIHPLTNKWQISAPHPGKIRNNHPNELLVSLQSEIKEDAILLLIDKADAGKNQGLKVNKVEKYTGIDRKQYTQLAFTTSTKLTAGTQLKDLKLLLPTNAIGLWTINATEASVTSTTLTLETLNNQIKPGEYILVIYSNESRWFKVAQVNDVNRQPMAASDLTVNGNVFKLPGLTIPVTQITLDVSINSANRKLPGAANWDNTIRAGITVFFGMQTAGIVIDEPKTGLSPGDPLNFNGFVEAPIGEASPHHFLLQDKNTLGASIGGTVDYKAKNLILDQGAGWSPELMLPVEVYGNIITASRGEKVENEKMGNGDAAVANQTFKIKKKPLTYHLSPTADNDTGVKNSLTIYVNGIKWTEVNSFFGKKENDQVYIVRQNDEGESLVTFGDGIRGERLPSGVNNIMANYRFGAEAACPPAGSVNQISKPVKGLQSVKNILAAFGGADAEPAEEMRKYAPKSALTLGRVISLQDMEALTAAFPGVRAVQTEWRWNKGKQCASAHIFYIGEDGLEPSISQRLRNVSDPSTSITVEKAQPVSLTISLNVQIDPRYLEQDVIRQLRQHLMDKQNGLLAPEKIGIGTPLYRSKIFEAVLKIKGTVSVDSILLNRKNFDDFAITPGAGHYFDIEQGKLIINGKEN
jgi:hypothetical protein